MSHRSGSATTSVEVNERLWTRRDLSRKYARTDLRPPEEEILDAYRADFSGRVLELGCGAGRVTGHLAKVSGDVHAIDISLPMVARCRTACPTVHVEVGDVRDLSAFEPGSCDVVAGWFNVLDVFDDETRLAVLRDIATRLKRGGLLVFSSHNLAAADTQRRPTDLRYGNPAKLGMDVVRLPRALYHSRRLARLERREAGYAILNDISHDYMALHYYIGRDEQEDQLAACGYDVLECRDATGRVLEPGDAGDVSIDLHYVARPA